MAKRSRPSDAEFLAQQAAMLERAGDVHAALDAITEAQASQPARWDWAHRAGLLLVRCRRYRDAVDTLRRAAALNPQSAMVLHDLGLALIRDSRFQEAAECFERSHALEPGVPVHLVHLAVARERMRDRAGAREAADAALALDPTNGPALVIAGECMVRDGDNQSAIAMAERALAVSLSGRMAARAHHLHGRALIALGDHDAAFAAHMRCNEAVLEGAGGRAALAVPIERLMHDLNHRDNAVRFERWASDAPSNTPDPVFLCGFPRSGTTLIEQVLSVFPSIATNDEQAHAGRVMERIAKESAGGESTDLAAMLDAMPPDRVAAHRLAFWEEIIERMPGYDPRGGMLAIDKQPLRLMDIGLVQRLFPRARMIVMIRDPRDVCLSALFQNFDPNPAMARFLSVETAGRFYAEVMDFWREMREIVTMPWIEVRYMDLVHNFEAETRRVAEFLGVQWTDAVHRFSESARDRPVTSASYNAVTEGINARSIGRWRKYRSHLEPILDVLQPTIESYGYDPD